jgi:hypothetical protein
MLSNHPVQKQAEDDVVPKKEIAFIPMTKTMRSQKVRISIINRVPDMFDSDLSSVMWRSSPIDYLSKVG